MIKSIAENDEKRRELIKNSYDPEKIKAQEEKYANEVAEKLLPPQEIRDRQTAIEKDAFEFQRSEAESRAPRTILKRMGEEKGL